ncbi:putative N-carbamoyl-D-amino acid hydrolase [Glarea lozoyensis 74030]|uniref:Putative N-carbamoyl-D-amino acid hydrolase n=1 Tax=Glarea lozoyensis (strain ATCC 74030 / MF5533) TaxID=1104152 RepID=H0EQD5_GLAL7|nr:putative N-carbamoyl-D-amino acid hydrolase [Glarea lozoyensis 74030]
MARTLKVAAAQLGPVHLNSKREETLARMITLLQQAAEFGAQLVLFPECALTTFFPRHLIKTQEELDTVKKNEVIAKYRKVHLPGTKEPFENPDAVNQLEKRYFEIGNLGFKAFRVPDIIPGVLKKGDESKAERNGLGDPIMGMLICNDRRWPEGWRCYGLQGAEVVLCGYNTAGFAPDLWGTQKPMTPQQAEDDAVFHHKLVMQSNSYMNSCFSISAAKAGLEDGKYDLIGGSCITSPEGHVIAEAKGKDDEIVFAEIDLNECRQGMEKTFDFARHRRTEAYGLIVERAGVVEPELL